jgi:hypothetical protein
MSTDTIAIIRLNIQHYERLLRTGLDDMRRATVERLLDEERRKLAAMEAGIHPKDLR